MPSLFQLHRNISFYLLSILNVIFLSVISISLYKILCRADLDIFSSNSLTLKSFNNFEDFFYSKVIKLHGNNLFYLWNSEQKFITLNRINSFQFLNIVNNIYLKQVFFYINLLIDDLNWFNNSKFNNIVEVKFFTKVNSFNYITFFCLQDSIFLISNDTTLVFFRITTPENSDISCIVIFLVSPDILMTTLTKLQCFCFDNFFLSSKDSVDLPVIFSIDLTMITSVMKKLNLLFFYLLLEK